MKLTASLLAVAAVLSSTGADARRHGPLHKIVRLVPVLLASHNTDDLRYISPTQQRALYDAGNADDTTHIAHTEVTFVGKTVCLEQTSYVTSVTCEPKTSEMIIHFNNVTAYNYARSNWPVDLPNNDADDFYLVSVSSGCTTDPNWVEGQRTYSRITDLKFQHRGDMESEDVELIARAHYRDVGFQGAVKNGLLTWGAADKDETVIKAARLPRKLGVHRWFSKREEGDPDFDDEEPPNNSEQQNQCHKTSEFDRKLDAEMQSVPLTKATVPKVLPHMKNLGVEKVNKELSKRLLGTALADILHSITLRVKYVTQKVGYKIETTVGPIWRRIEGKFLDATVGPHANKTVEGDESKYNFLDQTVPFNFPKEFFPTPFKDASGKTMKGHLIANGSIADIYCIECGAKGKVNLAGRIVFSIAEGVSEASLAIKGDLIVQAQLGIDAEGEIEIPIKKTLFRAPFGPGLEIPAFVTFAPTLNFALTGHLGVEGKAQVRAGSGLVWNDTFVKLDLTGNHNEQHGWTPKVMPFQFDASADVKAKAEVAIKASVGGELRFMKKFHWMLGLAAEPTLQVTAERYAEVNGTLGDGGVARTACADGLNVDMDFVAKVYGQAPLVHDKWWIYNSKTAIARDKCVPLAGINKHDSSLTSGDGPLPGGPTPSEPATPPKKRSLATAIRRKRGTKGHDILIKDEVDGTFIATDPHGTVFVDSHENNCATPALFSSEPGSGVVVADVQGRVLHLNHHEMMTHGVSRLRVHSETNMPATAEIVALSAMPESGYIIAMKPGDEKPYFLIVCEIEGGPSKLFLGKDMHESPKALMSAKVSSAIVGRKPTECSLRTFSMLES